MEDLIAIPVSEYERLKADEKRMNELRQRQIDDIQREIDDIIRLRQHEKMKESITRVQPLYPCAFDPLIWPISRQILQGNYRINDKTTKLH